MYCLSSIFLISILNVTTQKHYNSKHIMTEDVLKRQNNLHYLHIDGKAHNNRRIAVIQKSEN